MTAREAGRVAYEAFWHFSGGKSFETGAPMAKFDELDPHVMDAWDAAGEAILRERRFQERGGESGRSA